MNSAGTRHHRYTAFIAALLIVSLHCVAVAQVTPEAEVASIRLGKLWIGVSANGAKASFDYQAGFFPNDYNVLGNRGQDAEAYGGMGFSFATTDWHTPADSIQRVAVFGPVNDYLPNGRVIVPMKNAIRYHFPAQTVDFSPVNLTYPGVTDPAVFAGHSFDQCIDVTTQHIFNVQVRRKIMAWTQSANDDYVIVEVELTNTGTDTLWNFHVNMNEGNRNMQVSSLRNPFPALGEWDLSGRNLAASWLHYYGGRVGDTMRVFYEYSADHPDIPGDNMGAPAISQGGRLLYNHVTYVAILHASTEPYDSLVGSTDDFLQPKITYIGNPTLMPYNSGEDEYGSKNFWAIRGGFSDYFPMDTINCWPGTHHGANNDELGSADFSQYPGGSKSGTNNHKRHMSFGPYTFAPGKKLRFVYASGVSGLSLPVAKQVGERWLNGTLENPPDMPDPDKGWLPSNFVFPASATEMDKRKARWISSGIDSAMRSARRAKWNFEHNYNIPQAPPPPEELSVTGHGDGVEIAWKDEAAEARPDFAGYRILRRVGNSDTTYYQEVYSSGASDIGSSHVYKDSSAKVGSQTYYYVQAKAYIDPADPLADPSTRGTIIYSGRTLVPNVTSVTPKFPPQPENVLTKCRVVPNPYNINDPIIRPEYGWTDARGLLFINLPPVVRIRIFTENGDLVKEHYHNEPVKTGLWKWDMVTSNQQVINSGVYIALFEAPDGSLSYEKFLVVR
jgi:hypothetical protein